MEYYFSDYANSNRDRIRDPYVGVEALAKSRLHDKRMGEALLKCKSDLDGYVMVNAGAAFVLLLLVAFLVNSWSAFFVFYGLTYGLVSLPLIRVIKPHVSYRYHKAQRARHDRALEVGIHEDVWNVDICSSANVLANLPAELRGELRPLWEAQLAALAILRERPGDEVATIAATKRYLAIKAVADAHAELELEAQRASQKDALTSLHSDLESIGESDLLMAEAYATALREGQERLKSLS